MSARRVASADAINAALAAVIWAVAGSAAAELVGRLAPTSRARAG